MKPTYFFLFIVLLSLQGFAQQSDQKSAQLLWADEFNNAGLPDTNKWSYDVGDHGWGNNELQFYTKGDLKNARVENGLLILEAVQDSTYAKGYTSARLVTKGKGAWKYGFIEVKAKLPEGLGTWPAIWMLPEVSTFGGWPKSGEIDIMEHVGYDPGIIHGTVHTEAFNHTIGTQKANQVKLPTFHSEFHVYAIDWKEDRIDYYLDGDLYFTFVNTGGGSKEWPFDQPFHLILNLAVGGNWGGKYGVDPAIWPQQLVVDYVRVYDQKPD